MRINYMFLDGGESNYFMATAVPRVGETVIVGADKCTVTKVFWVKDSFDRQLKPMLELDR